MSNWDNIGPSTLDLDVTVFAFCTIGKPYWNVIYDTVAVTGLAAAFPRQQAVQVGAQARP